MPTTGLPPARANSVGLPGRMSMPWNRMPGGSRSASASADTSFVPIDEPPDRMTASWSSSSRAIARRSASASSRDDAGVRDVAAGGGRLRAQRRLVGVAHLPRTRRLGGIDTARCRSTAPRRAAGGGRRRVVTPNVASIARSCGRRRRPAGSTAAPRARSSPRSTTFAPGATARETSTRAPPSSARRVFDHDDRVRPFGQEAAGRDRHRLPAPTPRGNTSPIGTVPVTASTTGDSADAPRTSAPRTA